VQFIPYLYIFTEKMRLVIFFQIMYMWYVAANPVRAFQDFGRATRVRNRIFATLACDLHHDWFMWRCRRWFRFRTAFSHNF